MENVPELSASSVPTQQSLEVAQTKDDSTTQKITQEHIAKSLSPRASLTVEINKEAVVIRSEQQRENVQDTVVVSKKVQEAVTAHLPQETSQGAVTTVSAPVDRFNRVDRSQLQQVSFATITRNIPHCQEMLAAHGRNEEVQQLCESIAQGNWEHIIERYKQTDPANLALDSLKALSNGGVSIEQFCTLTYVYALFLEFPGLEIYVQPLFEENGTIDPVAKQVIQEGFYKQDAIINFFTSDEALEITDLFFEDMRHKPLSERCFFYVDVPHSADTRETITSILNKNTGLYAFHFNDASYRTDHSAFRMAPSFSMMQACVDAYGKENTIALCPTIGPSVRSDFRFNADHRGREIATPFPGYPCPSTADGFHVTDSLEFIFHDFYHCLRCSQVPDFLRRETGKVADLIASLQELLADDEEGDEGEVVTLPFLETFYGRMVDMEFSLFRQANNHLNKEELFLITLERQMLKTTVERMYLKLKALLPMEKRSTLSSSALASLQKWDQIYKEISEDEILHSIIALGSTKEEAEIVLLRNLVNTFHERSEMPKIMADAMYDSGLLNRLNMTEESLKRALNTARLLDQGQIKISLLIELLTVYRERRGERKV